MSTKAIDRPIPSDAVSNTAVCRLCGQTSALRFSRRDSDGYHVSYYECSFCRSLQTEDPHWLSDLYAEHAQRLLTPGSEEQNPDLDTWAVERTLYCRMAIYLFWKLSGLSKPSDKLLDWGGGPGLLVRMLRDIGIDAYNHEAYIRNHFSAGFSRSNNETYKFVTAFEVFEHFAKPKSDLEGIFSLEPEVLLISTGIYRNQGADWPYLGLPKSAHVFFYSDEAFKIIGRTFGYSVARLPRSLTLFTRTPVPRTRLLLIRNILSRPRLGEILLAAKTKPSLADQDHAYLSMIR